MEKYKSFANEIIEFVSNSDSKSAGAIKDAKNLLGIVGFASTVMGVNIDQAIKNQIKVILKSMAELSEEDKEKLVTICEKVGVKLDG